MILRTLLIGLVVAGSIAVIASCGNDDDTQDAVGLRIGYKANLTADMGPLWAHEAKALEEAGVQSTTHGYGAPHIALQALRTGDIDLLTTSPLEAVLEDIRKGDANYLIYCLQCFSPSEPFDAIVARQSNQTDAPKVTWASVSKGKLGVIPARQNTLIGAAMLDALGVSMEVKPFNPRNPLLSLETPEFGAVHVLGADVARARAEPTKYTILEAAPAGRLAFGGRVTPAGVGLVSKAWVAKHPEQARQAIATILRFSRRSRTSPGDPQLLALLSRNAYGGFKESVARLLVYAPLVPHNEVEESHFAPLMSFLGSREVALPQLKEVLAHLYASD